MFPDTETFQKTFRHVPVRKLSIRQDDTGPYRVYETPDGNIYPSITSILDGTRSKSSSDGLQAWRDNVGQDEAHRIMEAAKRHGNGLHANCEDYVRGKPVTCGTFRELSLFSQIRKNLDQNLTGFYECELPLFSDRMKMAGTSDLPGIWNGQNAIIDFKNSKKAKRKNWIGDYIMQGVGYARMMEERYPELGRFGTIVILIAVHGRADGQVFEIERTPAHDRKLLDRVVKFHRGNQT